jgi:alpha-aminoadipate carrier protein LysW
MASGSVSVQCSACGSSFEVPNDVLDGEITSCPNCGMRYIVKLRNGAVTLEEFRGDIEDFGE